MNKDSVEKIIVNNRLPFAVDQLWKEIERLQQERDTLKKSVKRAHAALDESLLIGTHEKTLQGLTPRIASLVARSNRLTASKGTPHAQT